MRFKISFEIIGIILNPECFTSFNFEMPGWSDKKNIKSYRPGSNKIQGDESIDFSFRATYLYTNFSDEYTIFLAKPLFLSITVNMGILLNLTRKWRH